MKHLLIIASFMLTKAVITTALAGTVTNSVADLIAHARSSNDVRTIIRCLPELEELWPQQPEIYLKTAKEAAAVLAAHKSGSAGKQGLLSLWTNVLQKPLPADEQHALNCVGLKQDIVLPLLGTDYIGRDKSRWLDIARFTGEIRGRIIPNYVNQAEMYSVSAITPAAKQQLQRELEENERKTVSDRLQLELRLVDVKLTLYLLHNIPNKLHKDPEFTEAASAAAHLTIQEAKELRGGN